MSESTRLAKMRNVRRHFRLGKQSVIDAIIVLTAKKPNPGLNSWVSIKSVADHIGAFRPTVDNRIDRLVHDGIVEIVKQKTWFVRIKRTTP